MTVFIAIITSKHKKISWGQTYPEIKMHQSYSSFVNRVQPYSYETLLIFVIQVVKVVKPKYLGAQNSDFRQVGILPVGDNT